jgi:hypothetical protein
MTDAYTLEHTWGFRPFEVEFISLLFEKHFNANTSYGMLLSSHYAQRRPTWVTDFLVVLKAEMHRLPYIDRSAQVFLPGQGDKAYQQVYKKVYAEDYTTNSTTVVDYLEVTQFLPEDDDAFDERVLSSLYYLQKTFPRLFAFAQSKIANDSQEHPSSYITRAWSMFWR